MSELSYDQKLQTIMDALEQGQAAIIAQNDEIERQSKIIDELVEVGASAAQRLRYCGDLWYDQGLESRAEADWEASDRLNLLISKAQSHKPNEGQRDE